MDATDPATLEAKLAAARTTVAALEFEAKAAEAHLMQVAERLADARAAASKAYGRLQLASLRAMLAG